MVHRSFRLIGKYALLLSLFAFLETILWMFPLTDFLDDIDHSTMMWMSLLPSIIAFIFNLITAVIVKQDIRTLNIKTNYVVLATVLFRTVGAVAFILYSLYDEYDSLAKEPQTRRNA